MGRCGRSLGPRQQPWPGARTQAARWPPGSCLRLRDHRLEAESDDAAPAPADAQAPDGSLGSGLGANYISRHARAACRASLGATEEAAEEGASFPLREWAHVL